MASSVLQQNDDEFGDSDEEPANGVNPETAE